MHDTIVNHIGTGTELVLVVVETLSPVTRLLHLFVRHRRIYFRCYFI